MRSFCMLTLFLVGFACSTGCETSNEPVPVTTSEDDIAAYEASLEETDGGNEEQ
ncbi:hypothetical protein [Rubripirellula reticaptiva]|uniref:Secreted protein n=1 Tax=Rubripirellula reticaptiva TaxID=2528013 RepID=A0A5C6ENJ4_9BACT|nr:hypothetical protein [Rubripirellula reticaptiva]TWU49166.1 hypothetical protein Poly59_37800 [Rubripirellula reticaptiva]